MKIFGRIQRKPDGSYLIDIGHGPNTYHAHEEATPDAYEAACKYADENPGMVDQWSDQPEKDAAELAELQKHLSSTDWYIIRSQETKKSVPNKIVESRQAARDRISELRGGA